MSSTPITSDSKPTAITNNGGKTETANVVFYIVRKRWDKPKTQIAAFTKLEMAENCVKCNPGYAAFDEAGNQVYPAIISGGN